MIQIAENFHWKSLVLAASYDMFRLITNEMTKW